MGLDMYLSGKKFYTSENGAKDEEGYPIEEVSVRLGYWRKHHPLHDHIVSTFANGVDDCREIELGMEQVKDLLAAAKVGFPRPSDLAWRTAEQEIKDDVDIISRAVGFLASDIVNKDKTIWRSVVYRASW